MSVFDCNNLKQFWEWVLEKSPKAPLSIKKLSQELDYSSDRSLGMVINGQRAFNEKMRERLVRYLKLTPNESRYISLLVAKEVSESLKEINYYEEQLEKIKPKKIQYKKLRVEETKSISQWYFYPICSVIELLGERATLKNIFESFNQKVTSDELKKALQILIDMNIVINESHIYKKQQFDYLTTTTDIPSESIRDTHKSILKRAIEVIDEQSVLEREYMAKTFIVNQDRVPELKRRISELIENFTNEVIDAPNCEIKQEVYQLNVQFYRQSKIQS